MTLLMFFMLFNYTVLRNLKDTLIIPAVGAEVIPFLKTCIVLPCSILFVALYAKLSNTLHRNTLFYGIIIFFLTFFTLFALYIYPNRVSLHPAPEDIEAWKAAWPNIQHIIAMFGVWSFSLFYVCCELWGSVMLILLFWQFANDITKSEEAKRFYTMFGFLGHFALVAGSYAVGYVCESSKRIAQTGLGTQDDVCNNLISSLVSWTILGGIGIMVTFYWINHYVLKKQEAERVNSNCTYKPKLKLSLKESIKYVSSSKYLGCIAILVVSYGLTVNLTGLLWRRQLKIQYPLAVDYSQFMADFYFWVGILTIIIIFFLKGVIEMFGWFRAAMITPVIIIVSSSAFFLLIFANDAISTYTTYLLGITPVMLAVVVGSAQQILCKSAKYSLFDPTKEMAYIPLDQELKVKGKAAVDVIGYSLGKASAGYLSGGLLMLTAASDLIMIAPYLAVIVFGFSILWIWSIFKLNQEYTTLVDKESPISSPEHKSPKAA